MCKCVLYYCHRVTTQLQLINISYHICSLSLTSALDGGGGKRHASAALPPRKEYTGLNKVCFTFKIPYRSTVHAKCIFIYDHTKSTAFHTPIFMKLPNVQQRYVKTSTAFHPNRTVTQESTVVNLFTPINIMWLLLSRFSRNSQMFNSVM